MDARTERGGRGRGVASAVGVRGGFSLLEMLIVVAIIGLIATLVLGRVGGVFGKSQVKITRAQIETVAYAIERFKMDMQRYPTEEEGLRVLIEGPTGEERWDGPYLEKKKIPEDGWGRALVYERDEEWGFRVRSYGADGEPGGEGEDADLDNRS